MALLLSLLRPSIVDQLIVIDSSPIHTTTERGIENMETFLDAISMVDMNYLTSQNMDRMSIKNYIDEILRENGIKNESRRQWLTMNLISRNVNGKEEYDWNFNLKILKKCFRNHLTLVPQDALKKNTFKKPSLFIGSLLSNYIPVDSHDAIRKHFPLASFVYVEGSGLWVHADKPKEFLNIVIPFLI